MRSDSPLHDPRVAMPRPMDNEQMNHSAVRRGSAEESSSEFGSQLPTPPHHRDSNNGDDNQRSIELRAPQEQQHQVQGEIHHREETADDGEAKAQKLAFWQAVFAEHAPLWMRRCKYCNQYMNRCTYAETYETMGGAADPASLYNNPVVLSSVGRAFAGCWFVFSRGAVLACCCGDCSAYLS